MTVWMDTRAEMARSLANAQQTAGTVLRAAKPKT
jgi:hypothetical protein